jgi:serine/threonine protein kinase
MVTQAETRAERTERDPSLPASVGRYGVVRLLGEGAMGRVLLAHDPILDRDVALKHLRADLQLPRDVRSALLTRMRHEARAAARVAHPNLVVLHDMGEDDELGLFLVFEYVVGPTLKARLVDGALLTEEAARLARELGAALTRAHEAGVLHRDVKPENVMLSPGGGKITDFGIARVPDSTLTHHGGLLGTPAYSAPETFNGGDFSPASDQFALAATLYEAVSGRRAFPGDDAVSVATKIKTEDPSPCAAQVGLPEGVDHALLRAMARAPGDRFPSCEAFGDALSRALTGDSIAHIGGAVPAYGSNELPRQRRLSQVLIGGAVVVVTAILLVRAAIHAMDRPDDEVVIPTSSATAEASNAAPTPETPTASARKRHPRPRAPASPTVAPAPSSQASVAPPAASAPAAPAATSASVPPVVPPPP